MPPEPAAGSMTFARFDSSSRMSCRLRASRRAKRSGRPSAAVKGRAVIAFAPPIPAENVAIVVRSKFTQGSRLAIIRHAVSAETKMGSGVEPARRLNACPQFSQRTKLGDGEELVGIGGKPEEDHFARGTERNASAFECAQVSNSGR